MKRRNLFAASLAAGALAAGRKSWASVPEAAQAMGRTAPPGTVPALTPARVHADQIMDIKVCLRPFRPAGPRLEIEPVADKIVVHNYGHGGSGWSLSWGSAAMAVERAAPLMEKHVAVIGCGIIGLTTAITAQRAGMNVTIYARDMLPHTRSVRANGSWTPDSRIALITAATPDFAATWERMARYSWQTYREYLGLPGNPVDFRDNYLLSDTPPDEADHTEPAPDISKGSYASTGVPQSEAEFAKYADRIKDIIPAAELLAGADNPFPVAYARRKPIMIYNFGAFGHTLLSDFYQAGGRIEIREFHSPSEVADLPERVVFNCTGYAARDLWGDKSLIPVRGQTAWLPPQPAANYGVRYKGAAMLSKSDGLMVQGVNLSGLGELEGVGNSMEQPNRAEAEQAVAVFEDLFSRFRLRRG